MRMLTRDVGVVNRRSKNPCSMSVASAAPPVTLPNSTPCTMVPARAKSRKLSTFGKFGKRTACPNDELPRAAKNSGKINDGMTSAGCRIMARTERFDNAMVCEIHSPLARTGLIDGLAAMVVTFAGPACGRERDRRRRSCPLRLRPRVGIPSTRRRRRRGSAR